MKIKIQGNTLVATGYKMTPSGPIALILGEWFSVNGDENLITEIRYKVKQRGTTAEKVAADAAAPVEAVLVKISAHPQKYMGAATGLTEFYAETSWPQGGQAAKATLSVLGRSTLSGADALADWTRRANLDGHRVKGILSKAS